jgi:hypothetical protein
MKRIIPISILSLSVFLIAGCQSSGVIQLSTDTYMISKSDAGPFATLSKVRSDVMQEVTAFAAKQGKVAVAVSTQSIPRQPGHTPYFEYQFRLLDKGDPRAQGVTLSPRPDHVIENNQNIKADIKIEGGKNDKFDLYAELTKLDDLRKLGIITDTEFESEKKKLFERSK